MAEKDKLVIATLRELWSAVTDIRTQLERQNVVIMDARARQLAYGPVDTALNEAAHRIAALSEACRGQREEG